MWRDQVNYFTRQIIKSQCFLFFFFLSLGRGKKGTAGEDLSRIPCWSFTKRYFLNWLCAKMSFANIQCIKTNKKRSETIFICDFVLCPLEGTLYSSFLFCFAFLLYCSLDWLCSDSAFRFWRNHCFAGVWFVFPILFSFPLIWSSTAPCCL